MVGVGAGSPRTLLCSAMCAFMTGQRRYVILLNQNHIPDDCCQVPQFCATSEAMKFHLFGQISSHADLEVVPVYRDLMALP